MGCPMVRHFSILNANKLTLGVIFIEALVFCQFIYLPASHPSFLPVFFGLDGGPEDGWNEVVFLVLQML